eukprot:GHVS01008907.1.p1 GENE.GHVS01008907.1~~GHVS01008907.1.p1  ORF type:complete len:399 (-),score=58.69 GHVS01008907.1:499-1695(-)
MMMSLLEECRGGKQGRGVREHHTGEKDKVRRGKPMGHKAAGFPGCFLVILFVAIGLTLSLKANADTNILVMDLDKTANFGYTRAESDGFHSEMQTALHNLITNNNNASEKLPIFVVTIAESCFGGNDKEKRRQFVATTFGVNATDIISIPDVAAALQVNDPFSISGSWPIPAVFISKDTAWYPAASSAEATGEETWKTVGRDIFLLSTRDVYDYIAPNDYGSAMKSKVLMRIINMGLQKVTEKKEVIRVRTIGDTLEDLVMKSGADVWFKQKHDWYKLYMVLGATNSRASKKLMEHGKKDLSANLQGLLVSSEKAEGATAQQHEWKDVTLEDLVIHQLNDRLKMTPVLFVWQPRYNSTNGKVFLTRCLNQCKDIDSLNFTMQEKVKKSESVYICKICM